MLSFRKNMLCAFRFFCSFSRFSPERILNAAQKNEVIRFNFQFKKKFIREIMINWFIF